MSQAEESVPPTVQPSSAAHDPYGIGPARDFVGPILAVIGLVIVAWASYGLLTGDLRLPVSVSVPLPGTNGPANPPGGVAGNRTPTPSNVVIVDPRADVPGSIVYVKSGNVWIQSGTSVRQLTRTGRASEPSWSPDGEFVYYIETSVEAGYFPAQGRARHYEMQLPSLMRTRANGTADPETLATGLFTPGRFTWFYWIRQPVVSPDGKTMALVSDGPDPQRSNVVIQLFDLVTKKFSRPGIPENEPLGHQDPAWRPDGGQLLLVRNGVDGPRGAPVIVRWDPKTGDSSDLTGPGYLEPAWSRDMRWVAATRTANAGTDVVILDARTGVEVFQLTDDTESWSPVWSPLGDAVAFLHREGGIVDLRVAELEGEAPGWKVTETFDLTVGAGLEATSHPGWFVAPGDLPSLASPAPSASASAAP